MIQYWSVSIYIFIILPRMRFIMLCSQIILSCNWYNSITGRNRNFYLVAMHITFQRDISKHVCMYIPYTSIPEFNSFPSIWVNSVFWYEVGKYVTQFKRNHMLRMRRKEYINTLEFAMCRDGLGHIQSASPQILLTPSPCGPHTWKWTLMLRWHLC